MIETGLQRGTPEWRAAHRNRITVSDTRALLARRGSKTYTELVRRLVLDREQIPNHADELPDPWHVRHDEALVAALATYRRSTGWAVTTPGLVLDDEMNWLGCTPHGLVGTHGAVILRPRLTARAYASRVLTAVDRARAQLTLRITGREWCDVVDVLDGLGRVPDRFTAERLHVEPQWLAEKVFPRLLALWGDVATTMRTRGTLAV